MEAQTIQKQAIESCKIKYLYIVTTNTMANHIYENNIKSPNSHDGTKKQKIVVVTC